MKILVLGGTGEARELANRLVALGHEVITSLAGRTRDPLLPKGGLRVGKFGGVPGLCAYLKANRIERLVDATHPYAGLISINAVAASQHTGIALVRFMRPAWVEPVAANWLHADDIAAAAKCLPSGARVMLTTGHEGLEVFLARDDCSFVVRLIERPDIALPPHAELLLTRPPYSIDDEMALFEREQISHLVGKNSGGSQTAAKLEAAQVLGIAVVMIARPTYGPAIEASGIDEAIAALHSGGTA
jgi:precorrin-6A/cobalt-precorrin-6A reductase